MASDYWSRKPWAVSSCWIPNINMIVVILLFFLSLVLADHGDDTPTARNDISNYILENQITLQPEPSTGTPRADQNELNFQLRHVFQYGSREQSSSYKVLDVCSEGIVVKSDESEKAGQNLKLRARPAKLQMERLVDRSHSSIHALLDAGRAGGKAMSLPPSAWTVDEVIGPNVTDKETVLSFARMAADAYVDEPGETDWKKVGCGFNYTEDFGWLRDGLRGHIYADTENKTVVIGFKGTSVSLFDGAETSTKDKENDNLFFSCCCGEGGQLMWRHVCSCMTSTYTCNSTCVVEALKKKNRYYYSSIELYRNVTERYPDADIWLAGHSLGGSVASLLGLTFGLPVVTFEAPGEALAASRLGLPTPPEYNNEPSNELHQKRRRTGGYHFGHTADPIFMGLCNSASSSCTWFGYAMETVCHTGQECVYDTVKDLGWRVSLGTHSIESVIKDVIEKYDEPPRCEPKPQCVDCYKWKYFESNGTETTTTVSTITTTITSPTNTHSSRTETCKTPGWWGCLDESTTSSTTTTSESTSTSTCKTPGWFGCKDPTTTTTAAASSTTKPPATVTVTATATDTTTATPSGPSTKPSSSAAISETKNTTTATVSSQTSADPTSQTATKTKPAPEPTESHCVRRNWFGKCEEWETGSAALYIQPTLRSEHDDI